MSKKTQVAAGEYCGLRGSREPNEVETAISGISKLLVSHEFFREKCHPDILLLAGNDDHEALTLMGSLIRSKIT
ncbi:unnamed protein product [Brassica rapa]|uniref:Uncharacterized protein n=2 Tax=Brassica TaxID=3705 RepID=A0A8D9HTG1_BRACM|nr:unnamed protein product [Brassica napus]CAG7905533.1 unnamed protein product [Brassica rapa]